MFIYCSGVIPIEARVFLWVVREVGDNRPPVSVLSELSRRPLIEELWSTVQEWELGFTLILRAFGF